MIFILQSEVILFIKKDRMNKDKFKGVVFGSLIGDALGGPLEFMSAEMIVSKFGGLVKDMVGGGVHHLEKGEITDDSQLSLIALESIVRKGRVDADDIAQGFIQWINSGPKDVGGLTLKVLQRAQKLKNSGPIGWEKASRYFARKYPESARGNGSLMRCYPAALLSYRNPLRLMTDTERLSQITHYDKICVAACHIMNTLLVDLFTEALTFKWQTTNQMDYNIIPVSKYIPGTAYIKNYLQEYNPERTIMGGYVLDTLHIGLWGLFHSGFEEGLIQVVNRGGDADTNGTVAGALLGACFGYDAIPERWINSLDPSVRERASYLVERIYEMS